MIFKAIHISDKILILKIVIIAISHPLAVLPSVHNKMRERGRGRENFAPAHAILLSKTYVVKETQVGRRDPTAVVHMA